MASGPCLQVLGPALGPSPLMSISEILFFASKSKDEVRRKQEPMPEAFPPPLSDGILQAASLELPQGGCAALQSCIMAWRDKKIGAGELVNFCRSMTSQSAAFRSVFGSSLAGPTLWSRPTLHEQEMRQAPAFPINSQICTTRGPMVVEEFAQPSQEDPRPIKRQHSFETDMAAEALVSLMNRSFPPPLATHRRDSGMPSNMSTFPGAPVLLPSIHALLGNVQPPSPPSAHPITAGSAPPSPQAPRCEPAFAKACKSGAKRAKEASSSSAKDKKQRVSSPSAKDDKASPVEATEAPASEEGSGHNKYCHFCQHIKVKRASSMQACENLGCNRRFCEHCLKTHISQAGNASQCDAWHCPICRKTCCCTMRECTKEHRHCKAYRYRRKRARQAQSDKDTVAAKEAQGAACTRNPSQALTAVPNACKPYMGF